ncbi:hypothetical protein GCM10009665_01670 [Kitasatospora nipponensis]|uniref:Uncharacterized protein n=1 Tax=Kitasatospora nipponensis TaxID=258049 RepID=A0ABN1VKT0_9ACTN
MRDEIIARARFLLDDLHLCEAEASRWLQDYFPDLEREERARYLHEAGSRGRPAGADRDVVQDGQELLLGGGPIGGRSG